MSAIFGAISLKGNTIPKSHCEILKQAFSECAIDRYEELSFEKGYMGCGIQYFTKEAQYEQLPKKEGNLFFDADVVLDNREELLEDLGWQENEKLPDGEVLFSYYRKHGQDALNKMIGAYCFVQYDEKKDVITIVSDAVGYRFVYYMVKNGIFYYSSLMKPLEQIMGKEKWNERWIADFIGQDNLNMFTEAEETPVMKINRIAPGSIMIIDRKKIRKRKYWDPQKLKGKIRLKNDEAYKKAFLDLYKKCVKSTLRSSEETAIMMSGGYDSTSVAVLAAPMLAEEGKKLYGFTSVPFEGYVSEFDSSEITDETELVKKTQEYIGNLECEFMHLPEMNGWFDRTKYRKICEIPYKSPQNMLWMYEAMERARKKGARVILMGSFGNGTVSYDNTVYYINWLFRTGRWIRYYKEVTALRDMKKYTRKSILKTSLKTFIPHFEKKQQMMNTQNSFAKREFLDKYHVDEKLHEIDKYYEKIENSPALIQKEFVDESTVRHYGEFSQKNSLYSGVIMRDPTRDKRILEFTLQIPQGVYTHNAESRRLVASYMKELMPEHVIKQKGQGRQSADLKMRIMKEKDRILDEWKECLQKYQDSTVIDVKKVQQFLETHEIEDMREFEIIRIIFTCILLEYMGGER